MVEHADIQQSESKYLPVGANRCQAGKVRVTHCLHLDTQQEKVLGGPLKFISNSSSDGRGDDSEIRQTWALPGDVMHVLRSSSGLGSL